MCIFQAAAYFRPSDLQVDSLFTSSISFLFVRHPFERIVSAFRSAPAPPPSKVFCILRLLLLLLNLPLMPPFQTCQPYLILFLVSYTNHPGTNLRLAPRTTTCTEPTPPTSSRRKHGLVKTRQRFTKDSLPIRDRPSNSLQTTSSNLRWQFCQTFLAGYVCLR